MADFSFLASFQREKFLLSFSAFLFTIIIKTERERRKFLFSPKKNHLRCAPARTMTTRSNIPALSTLSRRTLKQVSILVLMISGLVNHVNCRHPIFPVPLMDAWAKKLKRKAFLSPSSRRENLEFISQWD